MDFLAAYQKLPFFLRSKYFITSILFLVWMTFLDDYNFIYQWKLSKERKELKTKRDFYVAETQRVNKEKKELFSNPANLEKYAREHYYMKRDNEDIFVICREPDNETP